MLEPGRVMALDVGDARTGVAVTDPMRIIASPHGVVNMTSFEKGLAELKALIAALAPVRIVVGLPLDRHGGIGPRAEKTLAFIERLRAEVSIEIVTQDERFSTVEADRALREGNVRGKKRKQTVDKIAATHILNAYLDKLAARERLAP